MNVLVTGFSGNLGSAVVNSFIQGGHKLRVLLHGKAFDARSFDLDVEVIWGSLSDHQLFDTLTQGIDAVVHCAWDPRGAFDGMLEKVNIEGTVKLIESAERNSVKTFVHVSSVGVYGLHRSLWGKTIGEDHPMVSKEDSLNIYPLVKVLLENKCEKLSQTLKMNLLIIRPGLLFSDTKAPAKKLISLKSKKFAILIGRGKNHLPYIHVSDVAEMTALLIENAPKYSVYNCVPTNRLSTGEFLKKWGEHTGVPVTILRLPPLVFRLMNWLIRKLKSILGKKGKGNNTTYQILTGIRDIRYSAEKAAQELCWKDTYTSTIAEQTDR